MKELVGIVVGIIVVVLIIVLFCLGYVKAPPDMAFIISGIKTKSKVVIGRNQRF